MHTKEIAEQNFKQYIDREGIAFVITGGQFATDAQQLAGACAIRSISTLRQQASQSAGRC